MPEGYIWNRDGQWGGGQLDARGVPLDGNMGKASISRTFSEKIVHRCTACGVMYLNPVGNCKLCDRFTTATTVGV